MYGHQKIRWRDVLNKELITRKMRMVKCRYSLYRFTVDKWAQPQEYIQLPGLLPRLGSCHVNLHPPRGKEAFSPQKPHLSSKHKGQTGPCQTWKAVYLNCSYIQGLSFPGNEIQNRQVLRTSANHRLATPARTGKPDHYKSIRPS